MKKILSIIVIFASFSAFGNIPLKAIACMNCHGHKGNSLVEAVPRIAGLNANYIETELLAYKYRDRHNKGAFVMTFQAKHLDKNDILELAEYFSEQKREKIKLIWKRDPAMIAKGKDIFFNGIPATGMPHCAGCHSGKGYAPMIARQHSKYIIRQFIAFKEGARDEAPTMTGLAKNIDHESIRAVAYYLESL